MNGKLAFLLIAAAAVFLVARNANAKASNASQAKDVTSDAKLGTSPIQASKVAYIQGMQPMPFEGGPRPVSSAFQNPQDKSARNQYFSSTLAAATAPLRADYTLTDRTLAAIRE